MTTHRAVKMVKNEDMGDWFSIEKAEHAHVDQLINVGPNSGFYWHSGRISDADVEGSATEMLGLAEAIEKRSEVRYKRCAVDATREEVLFWSPRNSRMRGAVDIEDAIELAKQIRRDTSPAIPKEVDRG